MSYLGRPITSGSAATWNGDSFVFSPTIKQTWSCDVEPTSDPTYVAAESYQRGGVNPFTQWNPLLVSPSPYSTIPYGLQLSAAASSAKIFGYVRSLSATAGNQAFSITIKIPVENAPAENFTELGILLGRNLVATPTTSPLLSNCVRYGPGSPSGNSITIYNRTNASTYGTEFKNYVFSPRTLAPYSEFAQAAPGSMIRVSVNKAHTEYCLAISTDGETWFEIAGPRNLTTDVPTPETGAINSYGIGVYNDTALVRRAWIPWCRYRESATESDVYRNYSPEGGPT